MVDHARRYAFLLCSAVVAGLVLSLLVTFGV